MESYTEIPCTLTIDQAKKLRDGKGISFKHPQFAEDANHPLSMFVNQANLLKIRRAKRTKKNMRLALSPGELMHTAKHGKGLGDFLTKGWNWLKENATPILDAAATAGKTLFPEFAPAITTGRQVIRAVTGKGLDGEVDGFRSPQFFPNNDVAGNNVTLASHHVSGGGMKPKRQATAKQLESLAKARAIRAANLAKKKGGGIIPAGY